jgi:CheY-like chemotaxis protein
MQNMNGSTDILLVEDDSNDVRLAMSVLNKIGLAERCSAMSDGEEAMEFLKGCGSGANGSPPRLILLDLKMPRMNGFEFLQHVKGDDSLGSIPVVVLTSSREQRDVERAYALRANGYVVKGINFTEYGEVLRSVAEYWIRVNVDELHTGSTARRNVATRRIGERATAVCAAIGAWSPRFAF